MHCHRYPWAQTVNQIVATVVAAYACGPCASGAGVGAAALSAGAAAGTSAYSAGVNGGSTEDMFRAGTIAGATAAAFYEVGSATGFHNKPTWGYATEHSGMFIANIAGHAAVGCASTAAQGGSCGSGAMAAGFSGAVGPAMAGLDRYSGAVASATVGGVASVLGGGKFENGAATAAFGYLFNQAALAVPATEAGAGWFAGTTVGVATIAWVGQNWDNFVGWFNEAVQNPELPGDIVGTQDDKAGMSGGRYVSGPLSPEHGGTGDAGKDFGILTGGNSAPAGSRYPEGTLIGDNKITLRPGTNGNGPRIDIPSNGTKPHETMHYPP